jgi:hypothetical protein
VLCPVVQYLSYPCTGRVRSIRQCLQSLWLYLVRLTHNVRGSPSSVSAHLSLCVSAIPTQLCASSPSPALSSQFLPKKLPLVKSISTCSGIYIVSQQAFECLLCSQKNTWRCEEDRGIEDGQFLNQAGTIS